MIGSITAERGAPGAPEAAPTARGTWIDLGILMILSAILFLPGLGARDLWAPNEPNYAQAASEMGRTGEFVVPMLGGSPFLQKPILYYWLGILSARALGGASEFTLRLPLAVTGISGVLLGYLLVRPYAGRSRARLAGLVMATTFSIYWTARSVQMDLLVMLFTLAAIFFVTRVIDHGMSPWWGWPLAGAMAGFGFLSKGPIGVILPAVCLGLYILATGRLRELSWGPMAAGLGSWLAITAPWYVALVVRGRWEFLGEVLWRQNVTRYFEAWDHVQPWWYYLVYFWIGLAPWAVLVPLAWALPGRSAGERRLDRLSWVWMAGMIAFFSLSQSKRGPYLIPVAPAAAFLAAATLERLLKGTLPAWRRRLALGLFLLLGLSILGAGCWAIFRVPGTFPPLAWHARAVGVVAVAGGASMLVALVLPRASRSVPAALGATLVALYTLASISVFPAADHYKSIRGLIGGIEDRLSHGASLATYRLMNRQGDYCWYANRDVPNLETPEALRDFLAAGGERLVIVHGKRLDALRPILGDAPIYQRSVGGDPLYVFSGGNGFADQGGRAEEPSAAPPGRTSGS